MIHAIGYFITKLALGWCCGLAIAWGVAVNQRRSMRGVVTIVIAVVALSGLIFVF